MNLLSKLTKPLLMTGVLCLSFGVANAQVFIAPTGDLSSTFINSGHTPEWTFNWDATDWGTSLSGFVFNMGSTSDVTTTPDLVLNFYASTDLVDALGTVSYTSDDFCAQYGAGCPGNTTLAPIQFTFGSAISVTDGVSYTAELSYGGESGTYLVDLSPDAAGELTGAPEPATMVMMGTALVAIGLTRKRLKGNCAQS